MKNAVLIGIRPGQNNSLIGVFEMLIKDRFIIRCTGATIMITANTHSQRQLLTRQQLH